MIRGIAFSGKKHSGKSIAAEYVEEAFGLTRLHVKTHLAEMVSPIMLRLGVDGSELPARLFGKDIEKPLPLDPSLTARKLLQAAGNGFLLELPDPMLMQRIALSTIHPAVPIVNESIRFAREVPWLRERGFRIVRIVRPSIEGKSDDQHEGEVGQTFEVDDTIVNDGSLDDLRMKVRKYAEEHLEPAIEPSALHVVFVNGRPRSGKDTLVESAVRYVRDRYAAFSATAYSSIDPVRDLLAKAGIDVTKKTPADRKLLANLGSELEEHSAFRTRSVVDHIYANCGHGNDTSGIAFIYVREPSTMASIRAAVADMMGRQEHYFYNVWVARPGYAHEKPSNHADATTQDDVEYDWMVNNDGDVRDLDFVAAALVDGILSDSNGTLLSANDIRRERGWIL